MMTSHTSKLFLLSFICTTFICLSSCIPTQYSILGTNLDKLPSQDEAIQLFQLWKKEHGRVYKDLEEMGKRFETFLSNLKYITESNAKRRSPSGYLIGLNKFADWSPKEFQEIYLHDLDMSTDSAMKQNDLSCTAPSSLDWRAKGVVTAVKDQGKCGSCWTFSAAGAIEGINAIATGELITLSEQEILDCDPVSRGCDSGWVNKAFDWVLSNGGIALGVDYPHYEVKAGYLPSLQDGDDFWIVKNSWGKYWGLDSYIWIKRNTGLPYGACRINAWAYKPNKKKHSTSWKPSISLM